ncbi:MAG TPA: glycosyltransferase [Campylobacterales bacterium]|nr:glycosyltransferase [Campylobacterales bacterium]
MYINFVMSSHVNSSIFNHIIKYFEQYSKIKVIQTLRPVDNVGLYYYFRPHLESKLKQNSIVTVHHDLSDDDSNLNINKFIKRYKEAKLIICLNSNQKKVLSKYGVTNTIIIPHGYNSDILKIGKKQLHKKVTLGFFSSFYPRLVKGEEYLLSLFKNISSDNFDFILVGRKRERLAIDLRKYGFNCEVYENLPYILFNKLYKSIDCLLITSKFEGGPASVAESLATGTPIITMKVGIANDFKNDKGILFFSGIVEEDILLLYSLRDKIESMKAYINEKTRYKLMTWKEVISMYDKEFLKLFIKSSVSYKDYLIPVISYKLHTIHLKKRIIMFFNLFIDSLRLISRTY